MTLKAIAFRLPEDLIDRTKRAAELAGTSTTSYVRGAIEAKLDAPSLLEQPMEPLQGTGDVPRDTCAHPFVDGIGRCTICGDKR